MASACFWGDSLRAEQKDKALQQGIIFTEANSFKAFIGVLV